MPIHANRAKPNQSVYVKLHKFDFKKKKQKENQK